MYGEAEAEEDKEEGNEDQGKEIGECGCHPTCHAHVPGISIALHFVIVEITPPDQAEAVIDCLALFCDGEILDLAHCVAEVQLKVIQLMHHLHLRGAMRQDNEDLDEEEKWGDK
eukprot:8342553-Pyramimonas_sp.AAC.1